jgi:hypothetical protein
MKKFVFSFLGVFLIFTLPTIANAAELYGKFSSNNSSLLQGATILVKCDDWQQSVNIGKDGNYNVRGIPGNRGCFFTIKHPKYGESPEVRFNTNKSVVTLNAELRVKDNRILVLRR